MDFYFIVLRIFHIGAGVYWVGSVLLLAMVIQPALKETGGSGQKFVDFLVKKKRFGTESAGAGGLAGIAGILLYWHDSQGLTSAWMQASTGLSFGIGALFGVIAFIFGILADRKLKAMVQFREQTEGSPSDEQLSQMRKTEKQQNTYLMICTGSLVLSLWIMAVARYIVF